MAYPDAPEFQTSGAGGYSPDQFYTKSRYGADGERRWMGLGRVVVPSEMVARVEDLIHLRKYPAYHSFSDFVRDAIVHHLYNRLSQLQDPAWAYRRDAFAVLFEVERLELEGQVYADAYARWERLLREEHDVQRRKQLRARVEEMVPTIESEYWREEFERLVR